jgi:hypothetical protein
MPSEASELGTTGIAIRITGIDLAVTTLSVWPRMSGREEARPRRAERELSPAVGVYPDSNERFNASTVRVRSLRANSAATGFINRIMPKSSPSAT